MDGKGLKTPSKYFDHLRVVIGSFQPTVRLHVTTNLTITHEDKNGACQVFHRNCPR